MMKKFILSVFLSLFCGLSIFARPLFGDAKLFVDEKITLEQAKAQLEAAKEQALDAADMEGILTIDTLSGLMIAQNFDMPAGYAYDGDTQYLIRIGEAVKSVEELEDLVE